MLPIAYQILIGNWFLPLTLIVCFLQIMHIFGNKLFCLFKLLFIVFDERVSTDDFILIIFWAKINFL